MTKEDEKFILEGLEEGDYVCEVQGCPGTATDGIVFADDPVPLLVCDECRDEILREHKGKH